MDYTEFAPQVAVASGASVRMFFVRKRHIETYRRSCDQGECVWTRPMQVQSAQLEVAWLDTDGSIGTMIIAQARFGPRSGEGDGVDSGSGSLAAVDIRATAVSDTMGRIHVAMYDGVTDSEVRYLLLVP